MPNSPAIRQSPEVHSNKAQRSNRSAWTSAHPFRRYDFLLQAAAIVAGALFVYYPCLRGEFLWDDALYLTDNPLLNEPNRLWKAWFEPGSFIEYYPITQAVQWLQWQLWRTDTLGYHVTNLALHLVSCFLIWRLLNKFSLPYAWLGGLLFALHPEQVESVAWISELKNCLSLPPFLLAMCSYFDFVEKGRPRDYWLSLGFFLIATLCKISVTPFPGVILLFVWWKRGRIDLPDVKSSAPFFAVSIVLGSLSVMSSEWFAKGQTMLAGDVPLSGFFSHAALVGLSLSFYFAKACLPLTPCPAYPRWPVDPPALWQFAPWLVFAALGLWLWHKRNSWGRHLILGLGFFFAFLIPFSGVMAVSYMANTWVLDHFLYLPLIGLIGLVVAGWGDLVSRLNPGARTCSSVAGILALLGLAIESHHYARQWQGPESLWAYAIVHNPSGWSAYNDLALVEKDHGKLDTSIALFKKAIESNPAKPGVHYNLANNYMLQSRPDDAISEYEDALRINPGIADVHDKLAVTLALTGRMTEAIEQFQRTLELKPDYLEARLYLGEIYLRQGQQTEALALFKEARAASSTDFTTNFKIGIVLLKNNLLSEAIAQFRASIRINPDFAEAHNDLGFALAKAGRRSEAIVELLRALELKPDYAMARRNLDRLQSQPISNP